MDALTLVRETDRSYPRERLLGLSTALAGFCAAFLGRQDCVFLADAGIRATCVDIDKRRLEEMEGLYPDDWKFFQEDIYEFATELSVYGHVFDMVTLDPPTGQFDRVAAHLSLWCGLADRLVIIGSWGQILDAPEGWQVTAHIWRSSFLGGVYWTVVERI